MSLCVSSYIVTRWLDEKKLTFYNLNNIRIEK